MSEEREILVRRWFAAAKSGDVDTLQELQPQIGNVNLKDELQNTALHWAASAGHLDTVEFLVEKAKADLAAKNAQGDAPLHKAAWRGALSVVEYIVDKTDAVGVEETNKDGKRPVDLARHLEVKSFLQSFERDDDVASEDDEDDE